MTIPKIRERPKHFMVISYILGPSLIFGCLFLVWLFKNYSGKIHPGSLTTNKPTIYFVQSVDEYKSTISKSSIGSNEVKKIAESNGRIQKLFLSPNKRYIAYIETSLENGTYNYSQLVIIDTENEDQLKTLDHFNEDLGKAHLFFHDASWSTDSNYIAIHIEMSTGNSTNYKANKIFRVPDGNLVYEKHQKFVWNANPSEANTTEDMSAIAWNPLNNTFAYIINRTIEVANLEKVLSVFNVSAINSGSTHKGTWNAKPTWLNEYLVFYQTNYSGPTFEELYGVVNTETAESMSLAEFESSTAEITFPSGSYPFMLFSANGGIKTKMKYDYHYYNNGKSFLEVSYNGTGEGATKSITFHQDLSESSPRVTCNIDRHSTSLGSSFNSLRESSSIEDPITVNLNGSIWVVLHKEKEGYVILNSENCQQENLLDAHDQFHSNPVVLVP